MKEETKIFSECSSLKEINIPDIKCTSRIINLNSCLTSEFFYASYYSLTPFYEDYTLLEIDQYDNFVKDIYPALIEKGCTKCQGLTIIPNNL